MTSAEFEFDLERLRMQQEAIKKTLQGEAIVEGQTGSAKEEAEVPRGIIPEEAVMQAEVPTFEVLGTDFGVPEVLVETLPPSPSSESQQLQEQQEEPIPPRVFKEFPSTPAPSPTIITPISTPIVSEIPSVPSTPTTPTKVFSLRASGGGSTFAPTLTASVLQPVGQPSIFRTGFGDLGQSLKVEISIPATTGTRSVITETILPIVQPPSGVSGKSISAQAEQKRELEASLKYSEELEVAPKIEAVVPTAEMTGKTFLIPWHVNGLPEDLERIISWTITTLMNTSLDRIRILISGDYSERESLEGYASHFLTNSDFSQEPSRTALLKAFPNLVALVERSGLDQVQFQIEIRRSESLGWSLRSEFMWPHVKDEMIVVVPSHAGRFVATRDWDPNAMPMSFEEEVLQLAPCPVVQYKLMP